MGNTIGEVTKINKEYFTSITVDEVCDYLANVDGMAIKHIEKSNQTRTMAFNAAGNNGMSIKYINKRYWNIDLFKVAIRQTPKAITLLSDKYITPKLLLYTARVPGGYECIPEEYRSDEVVNIAAAQFDVLNLKHMTADQQTKKVLLAAMEIYIGAIQYTKGLTDKLFMEILEKYPEAIQFIEGITFDKMYDNRLFYKKAINKDPDCLRYIPWMQQTYEICQIAILKKSSTIEHVSKIYYYDECVVEGEEPGGLLITAVKDSPNNILLVDPGFWSTELVNEALIQDPELIFQIAGKTTNIAGQTWIDVVNKIPSAARLIPYRVYTYRVAAAVVKREPSAIRYIPAEYQTKDLQHIAIKDSTYHINHLAYPYFSTRVLATWLNIKNYLKEKFKRNSK